MNRQEKQKRFAAHYLAKLARHQLDPKVHPIRCADKDNQNLPFIKDDRQSWRKKATSEFLIREYHLDKLTKTVRNNLLKAVEDWVCLAHTGQMPTLLYMFRWYYDWPKWHVWSCGSEYTPIQIYCTRKQYEATVWPMLKLCCYDDQLEPKFYSRSTTGWAEIDSTYQQGRKNLTIKEKSALLRKFRKCPDAVREVIKQLDTRPMEQIEEALTMIEEGHRILYWQEWSAGR